MDSQHRHELEQNDLAAFFQNFGKFWNKYGNAISVVVLLVVIAILGKRLYDNRTATALERQWSELAAAGSPASYLAVEQEAGDATVRTQALLRGGDLLQLQASTPQEPPAPPAVEGVEAPPPQAPRMRTPEEQAADLAEAEQRYRRALELSPHPIYTLNLKLGLAAVYEGQGRWDDAGKLYDEVVERAGDTYPALAAQGRFKRDLLPELQRPVVFAPEAAAPAVDGTAGDPGEEARPQALPEGEGQVTPAPEPEPGATTVAPDASTAPVVPDAPAPAATP